MSISKVYIFMEILKTEIGEMTETIWVNMKGQRTDMTLV